MTGVSARVDFRPTNSAINKHRAFVRVEEGTYVNGKWKFLRIWNGDQTDYGLNFITVPQVLGYEAENVVTKNACSERLAFKKSNLERTGFNIDPAGSQLDNFLLKRVLDIPFLHIVDCRPSSSYAISRR